MVVGKLLTAYSNTQSISYVVMKAVVHDHHGPEHRFKAASS